MCDRHVNNDNTVIYKCYTSGVDLYSRLGRIVLRRRDTKE